MNAARARKLDCNPIAELAMFKYYQGRQEAYQNCLDALQEISALQTENQHDRAVYRNQKQ